MATINKALLGGAISLTGTTDTYQLVIPSLINTGLPHYLDNQVIEECYIICDTTNNDCNIILPPISAFKGSWGPKFYISNMATNKVIVSVGNPGDKIGSYTTIELPTPFETGYFHVVNYNMWALFTTTGV